MEEQGLLAFGGLGRAQTERVAEADTRLARGGAKHRQRRHGVREGALLVDDATFEGLAEIESRGFGSGRAYGRRAAFEGVSEFAPGGVVAQDAHRGDVDGLDAHGQGGRAGLQAEVALGWVDEERIGDGGTDVLAALLPVGQREFLLSERHRPGGVVPEEVILIQEVRGRAAPVAAEQLAAVEDDDVLFEAEGAVLFGAATLDLIFLGEGEDVVPDDVLLAVVLVEAAVGGVVGDVAFHRDAGAAFVGVEAPAAVGEAGHVMDEIMADRSAFGGPQRVDAAHVAEQAFAEVVEVIPFDAVALGVAGRIAPAPADRDGRIEEVRDLVVRDLVIGGTADPDADGAREGQAAVADDIVMNPVVARMVLRLGFVVEGADLHAARADVGDQALLDRHLTGAASEGEAVTADVREFAASEDDLRRVLQRDHAVHGAHRGLIGNGEREGGYAFGVAEGESAEDEVADFVRRLAGQRQQLLRDRGGAAEGADGFARTRLVGQSAGTAQEPLAGFVEEREQVLDDDARMVVEGGIGFLGRATDFQHPGGRVCRFDAAPGGIPFMIERRDRILRLRGADFGEGAEFLRVDTEGLFGDALRGGRAGKGGFVFDAAEEAGAGIAGAGTGGAAIADPELFEALAARRRLEGPAPVGVDLEGWKLRTARDHDLGARGGLIGDRPAGFT